MKKFVTLCAMLLCLGIAPIAMAEDVMQGFSGILWGTPIEELRDFQEIAHEGDIRYYKRSEDFYNIAGVTLPNVIYGFYQGKYFSAYMKITSDDHFRKVKRHLDNIYGDARSQLRIKQTIYIWDFMDVKIKLKQFQEKSNAKLGFYYVPLSTKANEAKAKSKGDTEKVYKLDQEDPKYDF
jgi:hypothetical protein